GWLSPCGALYSMHRAVSSSLPPPARGPPLSPYTTLFRSATSRGRTARYERLPSAPKPGLLSSSTRPGSFRRLRAAANGSTHVRRSEEHTSELQSRGHLVCRLLLEKKNKRGTTPVGRDHPS